MGHVKGHVGILFHKEDGHTFLVDLLDGFKDGLDDEGGEAEGGFVEEEELRPCHEGSANGKHLLFAAAEGGGTLLGSFFQAGKEAENPVHILLNRRGIVSEIGANIEIFDDGKVGKDGPSFGHMGDAESDYIMRGEEFNRF